MWNERQAMSANNRYVQTSRGSRDQSSDSEGLDSDPASSRTSSNGEQDNFGELYLDLEKPEACEADDKFLGKENSCKSPTTRKRSEFEVENQLTTSIQKSYTSGRSILLRDRSQNGVIDGSVQLSSVTKVGKYSNCGFSSPSFYDATVKHFDLVDSDWITEEENVQVIVRIRPLNQNEQVSSGLKRCVRQDSPHTLTFLTSSDQKLGYSFDHVAGEQVSQEDLFKVAGLPMVENCVSGYNSTLFAYGQTGSGKTHTMLGSIDGSMESLIQRGITPRVFEHLFKRIRQEEESRKSEQLQFTCSCSFLEIYNEHITDLLDPSKTNLQIREDPKKGQFVDGLSQVQVTSVEDVLQLLLQGSLNRKVAATNMNKESSRSHSVFTGTIESSWVTDQVTNSRFSRLHLVDLAGSERQKSSGATGERLKEASSINKSLTHLGHVIMVLSEMGKDKKERHVPYRDSKLTFLLQDSLGGNSKTTMIANISPSYRSMSETLSTLKFASRVKLMRNRAVVNEDTCGDLDALKEQIRKLKEELSKFKKLSSSPLRLSLINKKLSLTPTKERKSRLSLQSGVFFEDPRIFSLARKVKSLEAIVGGSLRREQQGEEIMKKRLEEIELLKKLTKDRERDLRNQKMVLRFREEKIKNLESMVQGNEGGDEELKKEIENLKLEANALREKVEKHPEVIRLGMENIILSEKLEDLARFHNEGERNVMLEEISGLRAKVLELLEDKNGTDFLSPDAFDTEKEEMQKEIIALKLEVEKSREELNSCLESNATMAIEADKQQEEIQKLRNERSTMEAQITSLKGLTQTNKQQDKEKEELYAHIQQRQVKAEEDAETIFELQRALKKAESEISALKEETKKTEELEEKSQFLEGRLKETEESLNLAMQAAEAAEKDKVRIQLECTAKLEAQQVALNNLEIIKKSVEVTSKAREEKLKENLDDAEALLEGLPVGVEILHERNVARNLFEMTPSPVKGGGSSSRTHSGRINHCLTDEDLRTKAEERAKRRRAELSAAHEAYQKEAEMRKQAEERVDLLEKEVEELASQLDDAKTELKVLLTPSLVETEGSDDRKVTDVVKGLEAEIDELRDELGRERELSSEAGVTAEEEWRKRQEAEMARASLERELHVLQSELEEFKKWKVNPGENEGGNCGRSQENKELCDSELNRELREEKERLEREIESKSAQICALEEELSTKASELTKIRENFDSLKEEKDKNEKDSEELKSRFSLAEKSTQDALEMLKSKEEELTKVKKEVETLESIIAEKTKLENSLNILKSENTKLSLAIKDHEAMAAQNQVIKLEAEATKREFEEQKSQVESMKEELQNFKKVIDKKDNDLMDLDNALKLAQSENKELTQQIEALRESIESLKSQLGKQKSQQHAGAEKSGKIIELEEIVERKQKEIHVLNLKLAESESLNHDKICEVLKKNRSLVKLEENNMKVNDELVERARNMELKKIEEELHVLRRQKGELIKERESWLEEIKRRQAEMVAARLAAEKLHKRDSKLTADNDRLERELTNFRQRCSQLDSEVKKLSGQQNLQQRIHHHAKIKEENFNLREQNDDLASKLKKSEAMLNRLMDELAKYRVTNGKPPNIDIDEEERLRLKLKELDSDRMQLAERLLQLSNNVLQTAECENWKSPATPGMALEALQRIKSRIQSTEREVNDLRLRARIADEEMKLENLRI